VAVAELNLLAVQDLMALNLVQHCKVDGQPMVTVEAVVEAVVDTGVAVAAPTLITALLAVAVQAISNPTHLRLQH
jgi:hypothetical protein